MKIDLSGTVHRSTEGSVKEELRRPGRLFYCENTNEIFVCERGKDQIRVYNTELQEVRVFAEGIRCSSVTCDCDVDGITYVADKNGCNIRAWAGVQIAIQLFSP